MDHQLLFIEDRNCSVYNVKGIRDPKAHKVPSAPLSPLWFDYGNCQGREPMASPDLTYQALSRDS